jgi:protein TonB
MPRDLFGNVTRPSISIGNRKWYTVPVSLLSHAIVLAAIVVVPILAAPMMPGVLDNKTLYRFIEVVPPPPPLPPKPRTDPIKPIENPNAAPTVAPDKIAPEQPKPPSGWEDEGPKIGTFVADTNPTTLAPPPVVDKQPIKPVQVGGTVRQPIKTYNVDPVYPAMAQAARIQGLVIIEATLSEDGRVVNARILRSVPLLDQAALDAVRQWQYTPTTLNGVKVPVIMTITVNFTLSK